jgi:hypothetical protein
MFGITTTYSQGGIVRYLVYRIDQGQVLFLMKGNYFLKSSETSSHEVSDRKLFKTMEKAELEIFTLRRQNKIQKLLY